MNKQKSIHHQESTMLTSDKQIKRAATPLHSVWLQLILSFGLIFYAAICPLLFAFFMSGNTYGHKIMQAMHYAWTTRWTSILLGLFIVAGVYLFADALRVLYKNSIRTRQSREKQELPKEPKPAKKDASVPLMIMRASLENCTHEQALEALIFYLEQIGFNDIEKPPSEDYGVHLIANSNEGRFAFMLGGVTQILTMTEIENFATGRAYFECRDALCIATSNATKDTKRRANELFVPYIDAAHYSEELSKYFTSIRSKDAFV